ncbi:MAG: KamA family radical SAM protein, partial [Chlorobium phaeobacteroides]|nr:KamA family radical SAM protein [Chlorobium phaeobacteroides]
YVLATNIGKVPLMPDYYMIDKNDKEYELRNHTGKTTKIPNVPE